MSIQYWYFITNSIQNLNQDVKISQIPPQLFIFVFQFARQSPNTVWSTLWGSPSLPSTPNTTRRFPIQLLGEISQKSKNTQHNTKHQTEHDASQSNFSEKYLKKPKTRWLGSLNFPILKKSMEHCFNTFFSGGFVFRCSLIDVLSSDDHQPMHP